MGYTEFRKKVESFKEVEKESRRVNIEDGMAYLEACLVIEVMAGAIENYAFFNLSDETRKIGKEEVLHFLDNYLLSSKLKVITIKNFKDLLDKLDI